MGNFILLNKTSVIKYYETHTLNECAKNFNVCSETIKRKLMVWGVVLRTKKEALQIAFSGNSEKAKQCRKDRSKRAKKKHEEMGQKMFSNKFKENIGQIRKFKVKQNDSSNGNWKGGRKSWWRYKVINLAGGKCEVCTWSEIPEILEAHHIDHNKDNNKISNGMGLCPNCHRKVHYFNIKSKEEIFNKLRK